MPATVIAERIGWDRSITVLKDRMRVLRRYLCRRIRRVAPSTHRVSSRSVIFGSDWRRFRWALLH